MNYMLKDPNRTSYRFPFYGFGADGQPVTAADINPSFSPDSGGIASTPTNNPTTPSTPISSGASTPASTTPATTTSSFSYVSPLLAFGTSFLASYIVARHIQIDKPKAINLSLTLGLLSGIGQVAAQILQNWIVKAQGTSSLASSLAKLESK
jgi:hypothetical protein